MALDVIHAVLQVPVPLRQVSLQQVLHETLGVPARMGGSGRGGVYVLVEGAGEFDLALEDLLIDEHGVVVGEGVDAGEHLVEEDAEGPPVDGLPVALVQQHLGGEVLRGPAQRVRARLHVLRKAEVRQLQVSFFINKNIFWL